MSGVYIPGIKIPTEKPVAILLCTDRSVGLYDVVAGKLRHIRECEPAIPVPDHGSLIEAERLKEVFHRNVVSGDAFDQLIDIAPTIIPADKEAHS